MTGRLELVCGPDAAGRSSLLRQYVSAPMHVSKPWREGGLLIVNAINATAGLFSGDHIETEIEVKPRAQMLVTASSATRAHRMISGMASVRQSIHVANDAWLEIHPALFIPHAGSNYRQETAITLEARARLLWSETVAPGRVASGEAWAFRGYQNKFSIAHDGRAIAREAYALDAECPSVRAVRHQFQNAYHGSFYAVGIDFSPDLPTAISALQTPDCWVGCARLDAPAICVRLVAADNIQMARATAKIRSILHAAFLRPLPELRRN